MKPAIKICGICNQQDAALAAAHGAQYLGLIFVQSSPRYVEPSTACSIAESINDKAKIVGVFQDADYKEIESIIDTVGLDYVQLHGNESPDLCARLSKPVIKAFDIGPIEKTLQTLELYRPYCTHFLFDKPKTNSDKNWLKNAIELLKLIENKLDDYWLAGGINVANINMVLQHLSPAVIDIASGVEISPGEKSESLITEFCTIVDQYQYTPSI